MALFTFSVTGKQNEWWGYELPCGETPDCYADLKVMLESGALQLCCVNGYRCKLEILSKSGKAFTRRWKQCPRHFPNVRDHTDQFVFEIEKARMNNYIGAFQSVEKILELI